MSDTSLYLSDANGTVYLVQAAGVWDPPAGSTRSGVYYEDEERPEGCIPLYRLLTEAPAGDAFDHKAASQAIAEHLAELGMA